MRFKMSDKVYSCEICGKRYKNSKSLRTHKYSYHRQKVDSSRRKGISPHLAYTESDSVYTASDLGHQSSLETDSIFSESSDLQNRVLDMEIDAITMKSQLDRVQMSVWELEELVRLVRRDMSKESRIIKDDQKGSTQISSTVLDDLKSADESNKGDIKNLEYRINRIEEQNKFEKKDEEDLMNKDLLDDLREIVKLFTQQKFQSIVNDIPTLRKILKFILETVDSDELSDEEFQLLQEISVSSKSAAKALVHDNFSWLVTMFRKMEKNLEALFETDPDNYEDENQENESQEMESEVGESEADQESIQSERSDSLSENFATEGNFENENQETESQETETEVAESEDEGSIQSEHSDSLLDNSTIGDALYKEQSQEHEH